MRKQNYPSIYRWAYATGRENELLNYEQRISIPKQTIYNWRKTSAQCRLQIEEELSIRSKLEMLLQKEDLNWYRKKRLFTEVCKLHLEIIQLYGKTKYHQLLALNKKAFVVFIEKYSEKIPSKDLLKWFKISMSKFIQWRNEIKFECHSSSLKLCAKKHPFQITKSEHQIIKLCLLDPIYSLWPKTAIHSDLLKKNILTISRSSFYKYSKLIFPNLPKWHAKKPKYKPLRANYVNEYWHMDISYFKTADGQQSYIYAIIDNFSRKIIAWKCLQKLDKIYVGEIIKEALEQACLKKLNLVSDGGPENTNRFIQHLLDQFRTQFQVEVDHLIALKSIQQSNSMIERFFRILKYSYLYHDIPADHDQLCEVMKQSIQSYNFDRPHYALNHLTPHEAYIGMCPPNAKEMLQQEKRRRVKKNQNCSCNVCNC